MARNPKTEVKLPERKPRVAKPKEIIRPPRIGKQNAVPLGLLGKKLPDWIMPGLFRRKTVNILFGKSNAGKSLISIDLMSRLAYGLDWINQPLKPMFCMAVVAEDPDSFGPRRRGWLYKMQKPDVFLDAVMFRPYDGQLYDDAYDEYVNIAEPIDMFDPVSMERLGDEFVEEAAKQNMTPGLIIIDNMNRVVANKWRHVGLITKNALALARKHNCAVVFLANPLKSPNNNPNDYTEPKLTLRGPGTLEDDIDATLVVFRSGPAETTLRIEKQRNASRTLRMKWSITEEFPPDMQKGSEPSSVGCATFMGTTEADEATGENTLLYELCKLAGNDTLVSLREMARRKNPSLTQAQIGSQHTKPIILALSRPTDSEGWHTVRISQHQTRKVRYVDNGKKAGTGLHFTQPEYDKIVVKDDVEDVEEPTGYAH